MYRSLQGAYQHSGEGNSLQVGHQALRFNFAMRGKRDIGVAGMLAGQRPRRFAIPNAFSHRSTESRLLGCVGSPNPTGLKVGFPVYQGRNRDYLSKMRNLWQRAV